MKSKLLDRFLCYVAINTRSDPSSESMPSTECQLDLLRKLHQELCSMGVNCSVSEKGYVYACIDPSDGYEDAPEVGFVAHVDTSADFSGEGVKPIIHENYDGRDIRLPSGRVISLRDFPHLGTLCGHTLITSDGNTLLGADDKAGVAEIMCAAERLLSEDIAHGRVWLCFTPDEEIGRGTDGFEKELFGADFAYTLDGSAVGEIEYENFNASEATVTVQGNNVHPGSAKNVMVNALGVAIELDSMLPKDQRPEHTEGYEGFYHLCSMSGNVEEASMSYILRDHDEKKLKEKEACMLNAKDTLNQKYGKNRVKVSIKHQYSNMCSIIDTPKNRRTLSLAREAISECSITPVSRPIRGGTDGAALSGMGIPCPNLGTGGYAFHGPYEHASLDQMCNAVDIIVKIIEKTARSKAQSCTESAR